MPATSEARIQANRQNSLRSTGPRTEAGKERSRQNGLKHGLTGSGVVLAESDVSEINSRTSALMSELDPKSTLGRVLVGQLATLSVKMERGAKQEEAAIATRVRHAAEVFDRVRIDRVELLFNTLAEGPRERVLELQRSPEGVDRLILALFELREPLTHQTKPVWTGAEFNTLATLMGFVPNDPKVANLKVFTQAIQGYFGSLSADQAVGLDDEARKLWACECLLQRIDEEIADLEDLRESFDLEAIELDRIGAADVALFDPSKEATLARRYESEARRGFFKALHEFRKVEAELEAPTEPVQEPETPPLGSSWVGPSPPLREPKPSPEWSGATGENLARGLDGRVVAIGRAVGASG
jgi:hypothetical protein